MMEKNSIADIQQFDKLIESAASIVIYGSKGPGKLIVDYLISTGRSKKVSAIVHSKESENYRKSYRGISIHNAKTYFLNNEEKDFIAIVSVTRPESQTKIFRALEEYGLKSCFYLDGINASLLSKIDRTENATTNETDDVVSCIFTEEKLCSLIESVKEVVIYSTEENRDILIDYFSMKGYSLLIKKCIEVIRKKPRGKYSVVDSSEHLVSECGDVLVLVAVASSNCEYNFSWEIEGLDPRRSYFCTNELIQKIFIQLKSKGQKTSTKEIQFIVAGCPKCGTTSLYYALQKVEDIYVPDCKEGKYFFYRDSMASPKEKLLSRFFSHISEKQVPGCIEPSFAFYARQIRETFGSDVKLCFVIRNPVKATYSLFKMFNRFGDSSCHCSYDRYERYCDAMFDDYIITLPDEHELYFDYVRILEDFLQYYPMEQLQIIVFEELVRKPEEKINEFLRFVGSKETYDSQWGFPKENSGDYVWADKEGWVLGMKNALLTDEKEKYLNWRILDDPETALARANEIENEMFRIGERCEAAEKIYNPKMTPEQQKRLEDFYRPSVRKLEKMLHKDLSKLWFE